MSVPPERSEEPRAAARRGLPRWWGALPVAAIAALLLLRAWLHVPPLDRLAIAAPDPADPPGTVARAGSIFVARGGPVVIGFLADLDARLVFAGGELRGRGEIKQRVVVPHGATAIRFAAPPGARLVWNPVGRRGDLEYVSPSSLSPDPPERAVFEGPGTDPLDGAVALGLLATLIATLCVLARRRLAAVPRATWLAIAAVFVAGVAVRWLDLGGAGQTWDEDVNWAAGRNYITNLVGLDFRAASWRWNYQHPPMMKLLEGIPAQLADGYGPARAFSAIWIAMGCALLVPIGARLFRPRVGVLAAAIATLLPPMVAHGQIVGHESPTVLWWALAILLALGAHDDLPPAAHSELVSFGIRLAWVGVAIGIALASRFINGLAGLLCAVIVIAQAPPRRRRDTALWGALVMPVAALATLYIVWPLLWEHPIAQLVASFRRLSGDHSLEPFLGALTTRPGPYYFPIYLFATLPLGIVLGVALGAIRLARTRDRAALIALCWFAIPLGVALSPVRQDGVRYVMPSILALALVAATGFDQLAAWLRDRRAFPAIAAAAALYLAITLARIHPYYLDYFGEHTGGAGTVAAHRWLETAWWGEGLDRAIAYVNEHAAAGARVDRQCVEPSHLTWLREDLWQDADPAHPATWFVSYAPATRPCRLAAKARVVFSVTADGAILAAVHRRP